MVISSYLDDVDVPVALCLTCVPILNTYMSRLCVFLLWILEGNSHYFLFPLFQQKKGQWSPGSHRYPSYP